MWTQLRLRSEELPFFEFKKCFSKKNRKKFKIRFDKTNISEYSIIRKSRIVGFEPKTINLSTTGDRTKKTINRTLAIGAAFTAAVILAPATFAREHHEPANGIQLATDIVNLVRAVIEPRPAPVIVKPAPAVVEKTVVVETKPVVVATTRKTVATAPGTAVHQGPRVVVTRPGEIVIPEFDYILLDGKYIPYYEGWLYWHGEWHWVGTGPRPPARPRWTPPPRRHKPDPRRVIVLPEKHHHPAPFAVRHEEHHHGPAPVAVHREEHHGPAPVAVRHEDPRREPARTVVVREDKPEKKDAKRDAPQKHDAPPAKKR